MHKRVKQPKLSISERWNDSFLVTYPVSYTYNGGIIIDGKLYQGFEVPQPKVPKGFKLVGIGCGFQLNARPPYATAFIKPDDDRKVSKRELQAAIDKLK